MSSKIFFSGIAGSGTSALAFFHAQKGCNVGGSDRLFDKNPTNQLLEIFEKNNIRIFPQDGSGINRETDLFVYSTAVEDTNPDIIKAKNLGIDMMTRPELLSNLVKQYRSIAVAGTSGKSTTSAMLTYLMHELGLAPNFIGGGRIKKFKNKTNLGNYLVGASDILILEACESDGSITNYHPETTIILNLDLDHHEIQVTKSMFERLVDNTTNLIIYNADDKNLAFLYNHPKAKGFSIKEKSEYKPANIKFKGYTSVFELKGFEFRLSLPGRHNLINALACITYLSEAGVDIKKIADIIQGFDGIYRRFDIYLDDFRGFVVDDYAHNPHKISYLMETINMIKKDVCYIFQPHGYSPTRLMKDGYIETFCNYLRKDDILLLLPIYYAGGSTSQDISSQDLSDGILSKGKYAIALQSRNDVFNMISEFKNFVVFGARDDTLSDLANEIKERLCNR